MILGAAFALSKEVHKWAFREKVATLLHRLNTTSDARERIGDTYGELGYLGKNHNLQFLGYLLVNAKALSPQGLPAPLSIKNLNTEELGIMERAHSSVCDTVHACSQQIDSSIPGISHIVNPYISHNYTLTTSPTRDPATPDFTPIAELFKNHPATIAITNAVKTLPQIRQAPPQALSGAITALEQKIARHGLFSAPPDFHTFVPQANTPAFVMGKYFFALTALKASLRNLAQLLYQAFYLQHLSVLNNDNVFSVAKHTQHALGDSVELLAQPGEITNYPLSPAPGDIILVKLKLENTEIDGTFMASDIGWSFSRDYGDTLQVGARLTDRNFNSFPGLLKA